MFFVQSEIIRKNSKFFLNFWEKIKHVRNAKISKSKFKNSKIFLEFIRKNEKILEMQNF